MTFPLMRGYDQINVVADLDPVSAVRDEELGERMMAHPKLFPAGSPDFGFAVQSGDAWRIGSNGAVAPSGARYDLAGHFRISAKDTDDTALADTMLAAADRLDPEEGDQLVKDEWEIGDCRYRVIRIEKFTLIGGGMMEPPRTTDNDPPNDVQLLHGHPIDPLAPSGQWEAQLRLNLVGYLPIPGTVPEQIEAEARHAVRTHVGVVVLPPSFTMVEIKGTAWEPLTGGDGPAVARDRLAGYFSEILPRIREFQGDPPTPEEHHSWKSIAGQIRALPGPEFAVDDRLFRTVRISRMLRVGPDGPEPPRPSDESHYGSRIPL